MKQLASVYSNTRFIVNYEEHDLRPEFELILLTWKPEYGEKDGQVEKKGGFEEMRINLNQKGLNQLIAELKRLNKGAAQFGELAEGINTVIREAKNEDNDSVV